MKTIFFVDQGNILRSVVAEMYLKKILKSKKLGGVKAFFSRDIAEHIVLTLRKNYKKLVQWCET